MTRPSRGISDIQEKARGKTNMTKLKAGMFPLKKKDTIKAKVTNNPTFQFEKYINPIEPKIVIIVAI